MTDLQGHGSADLSEQDLAIAALVGRYMERREHDETPCVHDLLAVAEEFGDAAVDVLRTVLACYEAMRVQGDGTAGGAERPMTRRLSMPDQGRPRHAASLAPVSMPQPSPTVVEVLRFEDVPVGSRGSRDAVVRWSDGSEGEALAWYATRSSSARAT
jgi:hypothetical protein